MVQHVVLIDPDGTGAQCVRDTDGGVKVRCVHGGGKTVGGNVTETDGIRLVLEFGD